MRKPADWMKTGADDRILEFLADTDYAPPKEIAEVIGYKPQYIGRRCRELAEYGLLENMGRGLYRITESGEGYLDEEVDVSDLENPGE